MCHTSAQVSSTLLRSQLHPRDPTIGSNLLLFQIYPDNHNEGIQMKVQRGRNQLYFAYSCISHTMCPKHAACLQEAMENIIYMYNTDYLWIQKAEYE